jgi:septal ring factor EnvC (AmiA/AmiB activator)
LVGSEIRETLLSDDMLEQARKEMAKLHKGELARRKASSPKDEVQRQLDTVEKNISRLRRAIMLTDDDIDELAQDLKSAQTERQALEAKLGATTQTLSELPDAVFNGLKYYREQVLKFEDPSGNRQNDVGKRALLEQLLGPLVITPVKDGRKAEVLELEYSLNTKALPAVLPTGKANAYILVAGARFIC